MSLSIIILAAGKGTRMKSATTKVMHKLAGRALLEHVIDTATSLTPDSMAVVCGNGAEQLMPLLESRSILSAMQYEQLGTGHAVMQAVSVFEGSDQVLVLYGDVPLTQLSTLEALINSGDQQSLRILTTELADPAGYGRIVRNDAGEVICITEQKDADEQTLAIREVNSGIMVLPSKWLTHSLDKLSNNNAQGEYYLTDMVALAVEDGLAINTVCCDDNAEVAGVNTRQQLAELERHFQILQANTLMANGVTLSDPARLDVRGNLQTGIDVSVDINVIFEGSVTLADNVEIGANCIIKDSEIGEGSTILANSMIDSSTVAANVNIGPFARLRPGTVLADSAKIGNFVETKNANIGEGSKVNHLSYIGDTDMGKGVNIGAGTITCNYDGANKHRTTIGDNAFIGSDSQLIAPITVAQGATVGAGTTLRKDAPEEALTLTKSVQKTVSNWKRPVKTKK
ncbi:MAG: bifunctional UDP-N-acetylglucosamine diphosphorylase/glucosamine-1-phosphate N-acetyltransferase GlmU [Gammaproteobacteria bacterium]|nr:bifunctional UDP-N-acetylglucosamine diphosphorylase/glucosamine-1-phosphate N-acetyltransferase GlmU [Gammaproteobacteria bacterium]